MNLDEKKAELSKILSKFRQEISPKTSNSYGVIQQVQKWTTHEPELARILCDLILKYPVTIAQGQEESIVYEIVQKNILENWENQSAATPLKTVRQSLLNDERSGSLLKLYAKILKKSDVTANDSPDHQKLIEMGLAKNEQGKLKPNNPIYTTLFNLEWVTQELAKIPTQFSSENSTLSATQATNPTKVWSGLVLLAVVLIAIGYIFRLASTPPTPAPETATTPSPSSPAAATNPTSSPTTNDACLVRNNPDKTPSGSALALDAKAAIDIEFANGTSTLLQPFSTDRFVPAQRGCEVIVTVFLKQQENLSPEQENRLRDIVIGSVQPQAQKLMQLQIQRKIIQ